MPRWLAQSIFLRSSLEKKRIQISFFELTSLLTLDYRHED